MLIAHIAGLVSGFKIVNKWSIDNFKNVFTTNGFKIIKFEEIEGRFPMAYIVLKKQITDD